MKKITDLFKILFWIVSFILVVRILTGKIPLANTNTTQVTGLYEACRMNGGAYEVSKNEKGYRIIICRIFLE